jgi:hypothetical protein
VSGSRSARLQLAPPTPAPSVPMSGPAELVRGRIIERRQDLVADSPGAVDVAASALAAMHEAAYGNVPQIRCDRQVRYRGMQLAGEKSLPLEDLAAIALRGPVGASVALAALRAIARAIGYQVTPIDARGDAGAHEALAQVAESSTAVIAGLARALEDSNLDALEAEGLAPQVERLRGAVAEAAAVIDACARGARRA